MDAKTFRNLLSALTLTQGALARFLDVDERTVRRWAQDGPPRSVELLLLLMERYGLGVGDF